MYSTIFDIHISVTERVTPDKDTTIVEDILPIVLLATPTVTAVDGGVGEDAVALRRQTELLCYST